MRGAFSLPGSTVEADTPSRSRRQRVDSILVVAARGMPVGDPVRAAAGLPAGACQAGRLGHREAPRPAAPPEPPRQAPFVVDEGGGVAGRLVPGDQAGDRIAGGGVDRGELPDRPDAFELADLEGVQGDQVAGPGGEVAEPERAVLGCSSQDAGRRGGELGEGGHALGAPAEPMPAADLLDAGGRQPHPAVGQGSTRRRAPMVGRATASASTASTWSGGLRSASPAAVGPWGAARPGRSAGPGRPSGHRWSARRRRCGRPRSRRSGRPGPGPGRAGGR
jgi:hypothetical protein